MRDHTTLSERKATKAPAIVAFVVGLVLAAVIVAAYVLELAGMVTISPAFPAVLLAVGTSTAIICVAWAHRNTKGEEMSNPNITPEGIEVKPGQRWRDRDKRSAGRIVTVISVSDGKARVTTGVTDSTISVKRMRANSTGFTLVSEGGK